MRIRNREPHPVSNQVKIDYHSGVTIRYRLNNTGLFRLHLSPRPWTFERIQ